jgi:cytochrome c oxidase cbb3-type subunit 2
LIGLFQEFSDGNAGRHKARGGAKLHLVLFGFLLSILAWSVTLSLGAEKAPRGKVVFDIHCAVCHGTTGDGQGPEAGRFLTRPADLRRGIFKFRSTPSGSLPTDQDLDRTIRRGLPGSGMVAQDHLSDAEIPAVIAHIKSFSTRWVNEKPGAAIAIVQPAGLDSLATQGKELFKKAGCPECHGEQGRGDGPSAKTLTSGGRPARPADLTRPLKNGNRPENIYTVLATGLDGTPMPSYRDALDEKEIWALAAYVARLADPKSKSPLMEDERIGREIEIKHQPGRRR